LHDFILVEENHPFEEGCQPSGYAGMSERILLFGTIHVSHEGTPLSQEGRGGKINGAGRKDIEENGAAPEVFIRIKREGGSFERVTLSRG